MLELRRALASDAAEITSFDEVAKRDERRVAFIRDAIKNDSCLVACREGKVVGYAVRGDSFFHHKSVEMLYVSHECRRRGVGNALLKALEAECAGEKLFVSTNESNLPMQALLAKCRYQPSGRIENLDDGDPELVYYKRVP